MTIARDRRGQTLLGSHGGVEMVLHVLETRVCTYEDERGDGEMLEHRCIDLLESRVGVFSFYEGYSLTLEKRGWRQV